MFNLKTLKTELSSANEGLSKAQYNQVAPSRDVVGNNFANGSIHLKWEVSGTRWWDPQDTYMRIRASLTKKDGKQLDKSDHVAPNMGLCASLFQSMEFRINGKTISRVSDFVSQVDALETRLSKSKAWLDSIGASTNFWDDSFKSRQSDVASDVKSDLPPVSTERLGLGYDEKTNHVSTDAKGICTFDANGGGALPAAAATWKIGDEIEIDAGGAVGSVRYTVSALVGATLQLNNTVLIPLTAGDYPFRRIRAPARAVSDFEMTWQPPLSIFKVDHALPAGKYELILNPQTSSVYQKYAVESAPGSGDKIPNTGTIAAASAASNYMFNVVDMYMMVKTVEGERVEDMTYLLDLDQTRCQSDSIDSLNFGQKNFDVSPSSYALTVAFQDIRAGSNTQVSSSRFKCYAPAKVANGSIVAASEELKLTRFFVNYAGQNYPSPDADPSFTATQDYTTQRYVESQMASGGFKDTGGVETLQEWQERGAYYHTKVPRDGADRSTRVMVNAGFAALTSVENMRVLLFDHSKQVARITVQDSRVINVQLEDN